MNRWKRTKSGWIADLEDEEDIGNLNPQEGWTVDSPRLISKDSQAYPCLELAEQGSSTSVF